MQKTIYIQNTLPIHNFSLGDGTNNVPAELFNTTDLGTPIHKIGNGPGNPGNHKGHIRYLRIWGRELYDDEIEDVYTNRDGGARWQ